MFEARMASFEGAEAARATATGMAAVHNALIGQVKAGDHVVAAKALFGSCRWVVEDFMPRFGVASTLVNGLDLDEWRRAVRPNTKVFFLESPTNPTLEVLDIAAIAAHRPRGRRTLVVDNVFATPIYQSPLALGADCVVYSATKHIDGQGRCLGGIILASEKFIQDHIHNLLRQTGPAMSPFNAWVLLKGLETLPLRVAQQTENAATIADLLAQHPKITRLIYPGRADHPQAATIRKQMRGGSNLDRLRDRGRQGRRVPLPQRVAAGAHHQQSRRREEPHHPSGDHDAPAADARRRAPNSASATGWCGSRSGSNIPTTSRPTSPPRWRRRNTASGACDTALPGTQAGLTPA